jgi:SAM-dependent methyltransferase
MGNMTGIVGSGTPSMDWPCLQRRSPALDDPDYLGSKGLSISLRKAIDLRLPAKQGLNILDVGCGEKPFYPFLKSFARTYIGTDIIKNSPLVDIVCPAERIDIEDGWADLVLCLSVLEHVDDPILAVRELGRVAKTRGLVFASTHGCFPWHPYPQDHWRWTQSGLALFFKRYGGFSSVELFATRGTVSGIFFLLAHYTYAWASRGWLRRSLRKPLTMLVNGLGDFLDRKTPSLHDLNRHVTAIPEFFVIAEK